MIAPDVLSAAIRKALASSVAPATLRIVSPNRMASTKPISWPRLAISLVALTAKGAGLSISLAASGLLTYLPLILVPPAVGIMAYGSEILADATAILLTLGASLALSLPFCGWLMQKMIERQDRRAGQ